LRQTDDLSTTLLSVTLSY